MPSPMVDPSKPLDGYAEVCRNLTQRQANFVKGIIEGMNPLDAYNAAGYAIRKKKEQQQIAALNLRKTQTVSDAIAKIRALGVKKAEITRDMLVEMLLDQRKVAVEEKQIGAANQSVMAVAKLMGLEVNRSVVNVKHTHEADQAAQELYQMLHKRGHVKKLNAPDTIDAIDAEVIEDGSTDG